MSWGGASDFFPVYSRGGGGGGGGRPFFSPPINFANPPLPLPLAINNECSLTLQLGVTRSTHKTQCILTWPFWGGGWRDPPYHHHAPPPPTPPHPTPHPLPLKRVLEYSASGRFQTSTQYFRATWVLGMYIDKFKKQQNVLLSTFFPSDGKHNILDLVDLSLTFPNVFYVQQNTVIAVQCNNSNNDGREVCCKVTCDDHFTAYLTESSLSLLLCCTSGT